MYSLINCHNQWTKSKRRADKITNWPLNSAKRTSLRLSKNFQALWHFSYFGHFYCLEDKGFSPSKIDLKNSASELKNMCAAVDCTVCACQKVMSI